MNSLKKYNYVLLYVLLLTPALFFTAFSYPYVFTQTIFFQSVIILMIVPVIWLWIWNRATRPVINAITITFGLFVMSLIVSGLTGPDPIESLFGVWERFGDAFDWISMFLFLLFLISLLRTQEQWITFFRTITIISVCLAFFASVQYVDLFDIFYIGDRVFGTFGNPAFLASYLLLALGISLYLFTIDKKELRLVYGLIAFIYVTIIILSGTRAAMLGLVVVAIIFIIHQLKHRHAFNRQVRWILFGSVIFISLASISQLFITRIDTQNVAAKNTIVTRLVNWEIAFQGFQERPVLGWGENNFDIVFFKNYNPVIRNFSDIGTNFDKAHNEFFDRLVLGGFVGFVIYLLIFLAIFKQGIVEYKKQNNGALLSFFLLGYVTYLFFFFHSIADTILFVIYIAYAARDQVSQVFEKRKLREHPSIALVAMAIVISVLTVFVFAFKTVAASYLIREAKREDQSTQTIALYINAWNLSQQGQRLIVQDMARNISNRDINNDSSYLLVLRGMIIEVLKKHPTDYLSWLRLIETDRLLSFYDIGFLDEAEGALRAAFILAPNHPLSYHAQSLLLLDRVLYEQGQ